MPASFLFWLCVQLDTHPRGARLPTAAMGRDTKNRHHGKSGPPSGWFGWTCLALAHPSQASHEATIQISYSSCGCGGSQIGWLEATSTNANLILVLICLAVTLVALTRPREPRRPPNLIPPCAPPRPTGTPPARYHDDPRQTPLLGGARSRLSPSWQRTPSHSVCCGLLFRPSPDWR